MDPALGHRTIRLSIRVTPAELEDWKTSAHQSGISVSEFVRSSVATFHSPRPEEG